MDTSALSLTHHSPQQSFAATEIVTQLASTMAATHPSLLWDAQVGSLLGKLSPNSQQYNALASIIGHLNYAHHAGALMLDSSQSFDHHGVTGGDEPMPLATGPAAGAAAAATSTSTADSMPQQASAASPPASAAAASKTKRGRPRKGQATDADGADAASSGTSKKSGGSGKKSGGKKAAAAAADADASEAAAPAAGADAAEKQAKKKPSGGSKKRKQPPGDTTATASATGAPSSPTSALPASALASGGAGFHELFDDTLNGILSQDSQGLQQLSQSQQDTAAAAAPTDQSAQPQAKRRRQTTVNVEQMRQFVDEKIAGLHLDDRFAAAAAAVAVTFASAPV